MKVDTTEFRTDLNDYFNHIISVGKNRKQESPFIVISKGNVVGVCTCGDLLKFHGTAKVFQTWVGKWRSDVFHFTVSDFKKFLIEQGKIKR